MDKYRNFKVFIVQPVIASYRMPYFLKLADVFDTTFWAGCGAAKGFLDSGDGLCVKNAPLVEVLNGKVCFQKNIFLGLLHSKPDIVFMNSNPRNISMWFLLLLAKIMGVKFLLHGQGLYHKPNAGFLTRSMYQLLIMLSYQYVCYTKYSMDSLRFLSRSTRKKLVVAENTLINEAEVPPFKKNKVARDVLFLGRLREMVNLEALIEAVEIVNTKLKAPVNLHVVGGGQSEESYMSRYASRKDIVFYGAVFDADILADISKQCLLGCYPGAAGLSVVHFMSLSLIPLVNQDITSHMGPEPSYIIDGYNGIFFEESTPESIAEALLRTYELDNRDEVVEHAFETYRQLNSPGFGEKLVTIIQQALSHG